MEHKHKYCDTCGTYLDEYQYYSTNNLEKYPDGRLNTCKKCIGMRINTWNPDTFLPILKDIDVPYIEYEWQSILDKACQRTPSNITGTTVIGKYLAKMRLKGYKNYRWSDTEWIAKEAQERKEEYLYGER